MRMIFTIVFLFMISGCNGKESSPGVMDIIPAGNLQDFKNKAQNRDLQSLDRLVAHYNAVGSQKDAIFWENLGASYGFPAYLKVGAARILSDYRSDRDKSCKKYKLSLIKALNYAADAHRNYADENDRKYTITLYFELNRAILESCLK